jgi:hypothetical protein
VRQRGHHMNVQPDLRMDKTAFIAWMQANEGRYELAGGRVVMMPGVSRSHGLLVTNLVVSLRSRLDPRQWAIIAEFGLDAGPETLRYPDIVVDRAGGGAKDYTATAPVLLVEVRLRRPQPTSATRRRSIWRYQASSPTSCCLRTRRRPGCGHVQPANSPRGPRSSRRPRRSFASPHCHSSCRWRKFTPVSTRAERETPSVHGLCAVLFGGF